MTRPLTNATSQSAWVMPVAKKLLVAKMVHAVAKLKRTPTVPTLVTNVSKLNAEPTITVQRPKNFVTTTPTLVTEFNVHHKITVVKTMVIKNVKPTNVKRLTASPTPIAVTKVSALPTNASLLTARPMVTVSLDQFAEIKLVSL